MFGSGQDGMIDVGIPLWYRKVVKLAHATVVCKHLG
jgi:hypothetical protein